jgi:hypothetical protein
MGAVRKPQAVKYVAGFIFKEEAPKEKALLLLSRALGEIDFQSRVLPFTHTDYYHKEFGVGLKRQFASFKKPASLNRLAAIKVLANAIEDKLSVGKLRTVNIDPGYLDLAKFVLASTKDYSHRIYIGRGIYAEITLSFAANTFNPREWTYPDYRSPEYIAIFNQLRQLYKNQIRR